MPATKAKKPELSLAPLEGKVEEPTKAIAAPLAQAPTPAQLVAIAMQRPDVDLDRVERLMLMQRDWEANEARKAFVEAMTAFKGETLIIGKNKHVSFRKKDGTLTEYDHAELHTVVDVIVPALARHGFSHRWKVEQEQQRIKVTCVLTHRLGHSESVELAASPDDSGGKNSIQAIASTKTYLERYTLLAATGLATGGSLPGPSDDDDGRGGPQQPSGVTFDDLDEDPRTFGNPPPEPPLSEADKAERRRLQCVAAAERWPKNVEAIKKACFELDLFPDDDESLQRLAEAWNEIPQEDQMWLWLAPTKGGVLTTAERTMISERVPKANAANAAGEASV